MGMTELENLMCEAFSTPLVESFHIALWCVTRYFSSVVDVADLLLWRVPLALLIKRYMNVDHVGSEISSISFGEELELLFRLSLCTSTWLRTRQLEERYDEYMHVTQALRQLTDTSIDICFDDETDDNEKALVTVLDGAAVVDIVANSGKIAAAEVLRTAKVSELRQLILAMQLKIASITTTSTQPLKEELINFLITVLGSRRDEHLANMFADAWNNLVGPVCRVHRRFKGSTQRIGILLYILTHHYSAGYVWNKFRHLSPTLALLKLPQYLHMRRRFDQTSVPLPPWWENPNDSLSLRGDPLTHQKPVLQLFSSRKALASYTEALELHQRLIEAAASKIRTKHWSMDFTMKSYAAVQNGLAQVLTLTCEKTPSACKELGRKRRRYLLSEDTIWLEALLRRGGLFYEHLLPFLPKYRWYSCAELLVPMLQYHKKWELANELLHKLLEEHVYILRSSCGMVTLPLLYRYQKRGEWYLMLAQNLVRLGDKKSALDLLEAQQQNWRHYHQSNAAPRTFHAGDPQDLSASIKRRARLLRTLFLSSDDPKKTALQNAVWEFHRRHFCRRSDRVSIERTLVSLHRTLRRWTPLPLSFLSFTNSLQKVKTVTVRAASDPCDSTLWRCPLFPSSSSSVEEHVLRWFISSKQERGEKWTGVHCEGLWVAYLSRLLLWEAYTCDPDNSEDKGQHPSYVWLCPFQDGPLDLISSSAFVERRRHIIEERLDYFEQCPRDELIEYVKQRCRKIDGTASLNQKMSEGSDHARNVTAAAVSIEKHVEKIENGEASLLSAKSDEEDEEEEEEENIMPGQLSPQIVKEESSVPVWQTVDVSGFPLMSLLQAVPQRPLCALLRFLFLSSSESGFSVRFSGFPDLVMWGETPFGLGDTNFKVLEVKSPNDKLSDRQIEVLDVLSMCGFDVSVARVEDVNRN